MLEMSFAEFVAVSGAARFGSFQLKSGKISEVFFDFGKICFGEQLVALGDYYADHIVAAGLAGVDVLFGPSYKGIPIAVATAIGLYKRHGLSIPVVYNRKAAKGHGEKGLFIGHELASVRRLLIVDDVFSDGGTKYEALELLAVYPKIQVVGVVVGIDREERDDANVYHSLIFESKTGLKLYPITSRAEVLRARRLVG